MIDGIDPNAERRKRVEEQQRKAWERYTLQEAVDRHTANMTATVISTAGNGALSVADASSTATGKLVNGTFALAQTVQAKASSAAGTVADYAPVGGSAAPTPLLSYVNPTSNDAVTVGFKQSIGANEPLRTGSYSKTLTFTLSTTAP